MSTEDPRMKGLDVPLRPPRTSSIRPPKRSEATLTADPGVQGANAGDGGGDSTPHVQPATGNQAAQTVSRKPPEQPRRSSYASSQRRVGSVRGNTVMLSTSVPYQVADALGARADAENITLGEVLMAAVRHHAAEVVGSPPPRPKRSGGTAVRQILVGPLDAEIVAGYVAKAPPASRLTTSRFLRHCLERELAPRISSSHLTPHDRTSGRAG